MKHLPISAIIILVQLCHLSGTAEEGRRLKKSRANENLVEPDQQLERNHLTAQSNIPPGFLNPSVKDYLELGKSIPGRPGTDYPVLGEVPYTNFYCEDQQWPGFFADVDTRCQTWHYCDIDGRQATFLCPNGTQFSQALFICDWWFNVNCDLSPQFYSINSRLYQRPALNPARPHRLAKEERNVDYVAGGKKDALLPKNKEQWTQYEEIVELDRPCVRLRDFLTSQFHGPPAKL